MMREIDNILVIFSLVPRDQKTRLQALPPRTIDHELFTSAFPVFVSHMYNKDEKNTYFMKLLWRLNETV